MDYFQLFGCRPDYLCCSSNEQEDFNSSHSRNQISPNCKRPQLPALSKENCSFGRTIVQNQLQKSPPSYDEYIQSEKNSRAQNDLAELWKSARTVVLRKPPLNSCNNPENRPSFGLSIRTVKSKL